MEDILYKNSPSDIRIREMVNVLSNTDKELPNLIILTILSAGAGEVTPIFSKDASGTTIFSSIDEIGTKFILDEKEVTSDDFLVVTKSQYGTNYNFYGLLFEDSNEHILKISLVNSTVPNFQGISLGPSYSANSITSVIISSSIIEIGKCAFYSCTALTNITIPNSVTSIGESAFSGCTGLTSITIPDSVTDIGKNAFVGCSSLTSVNITDLAAWCNINLSYYSNPLYYAHNLYLNGSKVTNLVIPNLVTTIKQRVFEGCIGLTEMTIHNSVTTIGESAFSGCTELTSITSFAPLAPTISSNTFNNIKSGGTLHVPAGSDYSTWMSTYNYYLGKYNWTKVEDAQ